MRRVAHTDDAPMVRIVVVNWNSGSLLNRCLVSLRSLEWPSDRLEVVVVDNASEDGSVDGLEDRYPGVRLLRNVENLGYGANNRALDDLGDIDHVGLVNPDVVVDPDWLAVLATELDADPGLGAVCPKILLGDGSGPRIVQNTGSVVDRSGNSRDRGYGEPDGPAFGETDEVFAWCGAAVLLRSDYLRDVGRFEERFFLYYEDTDLSWRGQSRGWRYQYVPSAEAWHVHGASTGLDGRQAEGLQSRNRLIVMTRNAPPRLLLLAWSRAILGVFRRGGPGPMTRVWALCRAVGALRWALPSRRLLRNCRTEADRTIIQRLAPGHPVRRRNERA